MTKASITDIKGIGPGVAKRLAEAGFKTVEDIAQAKPGALAEVKGFGKSRAVEVIAEAKSLAGSAPAAKPEPKKAEPAKAEPKKAEPEKAAPAPTPPPPPPPAPPAPARAVQPPRKGNLKKILLLAVVVALVFTYRQEILGAAGVDLAKVWPSAPISQPRAKAKPAPAASSGPTTLFGKDISRYWPTGGAGTASKSAPAVKMVPVPRAAPTPAAPVAATASKAPAPTSPAHASPNATAPAATAPATAPRPSAATADDAASLQQKWIEARRAFATGRVDEAQALYASLAEANPDQPDLMGELGNVYLAQGKQAEAADAYYEAGMRMLAGPDKYRANSVLGALGRLDRAKADALRQAIFEAMRAQSPAAPNGR